MRSRPTIFVTGSTGKLGHLVIDSLLRRTPADTVIAGVRSAESDTARRLAAKGVALRVADYDRSETLAPALEGVERLLVISSDAIGRRVAQHRNVIAAAKRAGVGLIAYTSILHADTSPLPPADEHRATETALQGSGVPVVLLRNGWYTENYAFWVERGMKDGVILGCAGDGRIASASRADYAEAAAVVLTSRERQSRVYELAGDRSFTMHDLSAAISAAAGKPVTYQDLSEAAFRSALVSTGMTDAFVAMLSGVDVGIAQGALDDLNGELGRLIGRPTTPYRSSVEAIIASAG